MLLFSAKFFAAAAILLIVWMEVGIYYQNILYSTAKVFLSFLGYTPFQISAVKLGNAYLTNFNIVSFIALVIATPVKTRRMGRMLLTGVPIIFSMHLIDLIAHFPLYIRHSELAKVIVYSIGVGEIAIPFILWFVIAYSDVFAREKG